MGSAITARTTVHEWPRSCVRRLHLADGRFVQTTAPYLHALAAQTQDEAVLAAIGGPSSLLIHTPMCQWTFSGYGRCSKSSGWQLVPSSGSHQGAQSMIG